MHSPYTLRIYVFVNSGLRQTLLHYGHSGVDGISLPTFPVTGADSPVHAYFGDDGISLPKCFCWRILSPTRQLTSILIAFPPRLPISFQKSPYTSGSCLHNTTNIVASCLWPAVFDGKVRDRYGSQQILWPALCGQLCLMVRDRYGIAPGVTQTNKQIPNERAWKLRALRYALLPSSSCMLVELMEMLFPLISYIIVLQTRFNEILK